MKLITNRNKFIFAIAAIAVSLVGCDKIGQTAPGGDASQVQSDLAKLSLDDRVKIEMGSPAPLEQKRQRIEDMYKKEGKTVPADVEAKLGGVTAH